MPYICVSRCVPIRFHSGFIVVTIVRRWLTHRRSKCGLYMPGPLVWRYILYGCLFLRIRCTLFYEQKNMLILNHSMWLCVVDRRADMAQVNLIFWRLWHHILNWLHITISICEELHHGDHQMRELHKHLPCTYIYIYHRLLISNNHDMEESVCCGATQALSDITTLIGKWLRGPNGANGWLTSNDHKPFNSTCSICCLWLTFDTHSDSSNPLICYAQYT